jgi:hypothetical protein
MPSTLLPRRWALTPPFHPYPHRVPFEDVPKVFLRAITGLRAAGGIFSVALSVNSSTGFSLCFFLGGPFLAASRRNITDSSLCYRPPGVTRRIALHLRPYGPRVFSARAEWCPDFPPAQSACAFQASDRPAHPPSLLYRESLLRELRCCATVPGIESRHARPRIQGFS